MDVEAYCENLNTRITEWKAKVYDMIRKLDQFSHDRKQEVSVSVKEVTGIIDEVEQKVSKLRAECPSDWSPQKNEIDKKIEQLNEAWDRAWSEISMMSPDDY